MILRSKCIKEVFELIDVVICVISAKVEYCIIVRIHHLFDTCADFIDNFASLVYNCDIVVENTSLYDYFVFNEIQFTFLKEFFTLLGKKIGC